MAPAIRSGGGVQFPKHGDVLAGRKKILTEWNLAGYRRAQQDEGQIRRGDVSYVDKKKASELLGRSGLQLPRVPSLNTDRTKILTERTLPAIGARSRKLTGWVT